MGIPSDSSVEIKTQYCSNIEFKCSTGIRVSILYHSNYLYFATVCLQKSKETQGVIVFKQQELGAISWAFQ